MSCEDRRPVIEASCARSTAGRFDGIANTPEEALQIAEWLEIKLEGCTEANGKPCPGSAFCEIAAAYFRLTSPDSTR
jgi:hypothetical protein